MKKKTRKIDADHAGEIIKTIDETIAGVHLKALANTQELMAARDEIINGDLTKETYENVAQIIEQYT